MIATARRAARKPLPAHFKSGEMLTLNDFLRRYERMHHVKKAPLQYVKQKPDKHGRLHSRVFKGLMLDVRAALEENKARMLAALD